MGTKGLILGALLGVLAFGLLRFAFAPLAHGTHYHANWAVFLDGERLDLSGDAFMEEVTACRADDSGILPEQRIHMHENNQDVVHVHHEGATWGALMANLGMALGEDWLLLADGRRPVADEGRYLVFVLNGLRVPEVHNRVVRPGDRLLISYTDDPAAAETTEFARVADDAETYDAMQDPASCAGHGELPFLDRLRLAFWG